ncbi:MAG: class I SAM-dependent methyltransferase [Planctomycetota bacterium]
MDERGAAMCIACSSKPIDQQQLDAFGERFMGMLNHSMLMMMISLGHRSGLFDAMADGIARTSDELAVKADLNERYVREWLGAMVTGGIVERDRATKTHRLPPEHANWLSRAAPEANLAVFAQYLSVLASVEDEVLECFQRGGGVAYEAYGRFHDVMAEDRGQSIVPVLVDEVVSLMPGLRDRLNRRIDVLDIGCGRGRALMALAAAFPKSRFRGYDLSREAIAWARAEAERQGVTNVRFEVRDLTNWREPAAFDWITALDAIHDQARPDLVLAAVRQALRPGGIFLMQDIDLSSDPSDNIDHPLAAMLYSISCMHCMTVSLARGGLGLGTAWGRQRAEAMLNEAGFDQIRLHRFEHDVQNVIYIMETR